MFDLIALIASAAFGVAIGIALVAAAMWPFFKVREWRRARQQAIYLNAYTS